MAKAGMISTRRLFGLAALALCALAPNQAHATAYTYSGIAQFNGNTTPSAFNNPSTPVADTQGGFYVPLLTGGPNGAAGGIVHIARTQTGWNTVTLHSFTNSVNGLYPNILLKDAKGNLYGTTYKGGTDNVGIAFKMTAPPAGKTAWGFTKLYDFQDNASYDPDHSDAHPYAAALTADGKLIVGTQGIPKTDGGPANSSLVELSPGKVGQKWTETLIQKFPKIHLNSVNVTSTGTVIGTKPYTLNVTNGSIWQWTLKNQKWTTSQLYEFPRYTSAYGSNPVLAEQLDKTNTLYGTAQYGGTGGNGTVFKLTPPTITGNSWTVTVLYSFPYSGTQGRYPAPLLAMDSSGSLEGSTMQGGPKNYGTIFKLTPSANGKTWAESMIYSGSKLAPRAFVVGTSGQNPIGITSGSSAVSGSLFMLTKPASTALEPSNISAPGYKVVGSRIMPQSHTLQ